jgi:phosphatidylserine synthase
VRLFYLILNIIGLEMYIYMVRSTIQLFVNEYENILLFLFYISLLMLSTVTVYHIKKTIKKIPIEFSLLFILLTLVSVLSANYIADNFLLRAPIGFK